MRRLSEHDEGTHFTSPATGVSSEHDLLFAEPANGGRARFWIFKLRLCLNLSLSVADDGADRISHWLLRAGHIFFSDAEQCRQLAILFSTLLNATSGTADQ